MNYRLFDESEIKSLWFPRKVTGKFENGQVAIIGGSMLFHGAPILALRAASRLVDMVYFSVPKEVGEVVEAVKSSLCAFIFVPWSDIDEYVVKSDAALIGPGMLRFHSEKGIDHNGVCDHAGRETRELTERLLTRHKSQRWVVDGGSLQVIEPRVLPPNCVVTPNEKEFNMLFGVDLRFKTLDSRIECVCEQAKKYGVVVALKGIETIISDGSEVIVVNGGSPGLSKGGTGDLVAGLTAGFLAKNPPLLAAAAANFLVKRAGEELEEERGVMYNADDVAEKVPEVYGKLLESE